MKKIIVFYFLILSVFSLKAQQIMVGDSAVVSLITCSPGPEVYAKFGHTAIRYMEPNGMDVVFNYGIFNFNQPGFYMKFIKGETDYQLGVYETAYFLPEYKERNSQVTEQVLNLTKEEKQRLINNLFVNYLPENREYRYNFIFDNCATRPRNRILEVVKDKVDYQAHIETKTFREWVSSYTGEKSWTQFGIDLLFGRDADKVSSRWNAMFLPEILEKEFGSVMLISNEGAEHPLVSSEKIIVSKTDTEQTSQWYLEPLFITSLILLIVFLITLYEFRTKKQLKIIDSKLLIVSGLVGVILFYLMFFSVHPLVKNNFNLLWCNPVNLFVGIFLWVKKWRPIVTYFQLANVLLFFAVLIVVVLSIQEINIAAVPLIILLLIRSISWLWFNKQIIKKLI